MSDYYDVLGLTRYAGRPGPAPPHPRGGGRINTCVATCPVLAPGTGFQRPGERVAGAGEGGGLRFESTDAPAGAGSVDG